MPNFVPLTTYQQYSPEEMKQRSVTFCEEMQRRRTVREYSNRAVPREIIEQCIATAGSGPSGANLQPWHFLAVNNPEIKKKIRLAAEEEEREFYANRAPDEWIKALEPFGTNDQKGFLETAPWLIAVFVKKYGFDQAGQRIKHYYTSESVGIASGMLIAALHHAGLATLTHTPSPMGFLKTVLQRPNNERPYLLVVAGYPGKDVKVPDIHRKDLNEIATFME